MRDKLIIFGLILLSISFILFIVKELMRWLQNSVFGVK